MSSPATPTPAASAPGRTYPLRLLSISFYGAGAAASTQFSGALGRQRDYSDTVEDYLMVVPGPADGQSEVIDHGSGLRVMTLPASGHLSFLRAVVAHVPALARRERTSALLVDNTHLATLAGAVVKWRTGVPLIVNSMADMPYNPHYELERRSNGLKNALFRLLLPWVDLLRVSTQAEVERLTQAGVPEERLHLLHFYVDEAQFAEAPERSEGAGEGAGMTLLFVGRLGSQKDIPVLLASFAQVAPEFPEATLRIVGGGPDSERLAARARELGIEERVVFTGAIPYERVIEEYRSADAFVISSLYEGTCMVLHEAALMGLPIIATEFAGAKDFVRDGVEGYLAPIRDVDAFAAALRKLLADPAKAREMGAASRERVQAFSRASARREWDALCARIVGLVPATPAAGQGGETSRTEQGGETSPKAG
ncbi:glycosyltransferase [Patescibacteria group bacterium]|jgi:glycosyltransferase involved in cell wall biosynthesis|nr:glycosyltransferase [Patescibacteria group bacterium]